MEPVGGKGGRADVTWHRLPEAIGLLLRGRTARTALPVCLFVGTVLSAVNQGGVIASGEATDQTWIRIGINYLVPYLVASTGFLAARRMAVPAALSEPAAVPENAEERLTAAVPPASSPAERVPSRSR